MSVRHGSPFKRVALISVCLSFVLQGNRLSHQGRLTFPDQILDGTSRRSACRRCLKRAVPHDFYTTLHTHDFTLDSGLHLLETTFNI